MKFSVAFSTAATRADARLDLPKKEIKIMPCPYREVNYVKSHKVSSASSKCHVHFLLFCIFSHSMLFTF